MSDVKNRLEFTLDVDGTSLNVLDFDLVEQLNEVSSLELRCTKYGDSGEHADPAALIDKPATFRFAREDGSQSASFTASSSKPCARRATTARWRRT